MPVGPYHASGGRTMPVGTLPCKRGPYHDSGGRTVPVGAYLANVIMNNMKLCLLRKQIVNLSLAGTKTSVNILSTRVAHQFNNCLSAMYILRLSLPAWELCYI